MKQIRGEKSTLGRLKCACERDGRSRRHVQYVTDDERELVAKVEKRIAEREKKRKSETNTKAKSKTGIDRE